MNIFKINLSLFITVLVISGCGNKEKKQHVEDDYNIVYNIQNQNQTTFGLCGELSSSDSLQLLTDSGDTLYLGVYGARESSKIHGGYNVGDKMAVLIDDSMKNATLIINENVLLGNWVMLNPLDGSSYVGISMRDGGIAESIEQSTIVYKTWRIIDGKLEITLVREGGGDMEETNVYDIVKLDSDSLIYENEEDRMEYFREGMKQPEY